MTATLAEINGAGRAQFVALVGHVFEHSPWIAEETWPRRPFGSVEELHRELCATLRGAGRERQLALIRAHPDLAGRLAQPLGGIEALSLSNGQKELTAESAREQATAGLNRLTPDELAEFQRLNEAYRTRFGFPFVICARLNAKEAIMSAMRIRLGHAPEEEFKTALGEIEKIAQFRLNDLFKA